jgi:arabinose-5-phosphate isomerase
MRLLYFAPMIPKNHATSSSAPETQKPYAERVLSIALKTLTIEAEAITDLAQRLTGTQASAFVQAVSLLLECRGRVVVSGMGKSGHIARKVAATLASTGTPAFFVHPGEASHGDLGMITAEDVLIAFSNSGETAELLAILPTVQRSGARLIGISGADQSTLARLADAHLNAGVVREACPLNLAPTASTTAALALGDALAIAVLDARGFQPEDFARSHPGGALGRRLLTRVRDVMRTGDAIPRIPVAATLSDAILEMTRKGLGMTSIVDTQNRLVGIFTDGDLRRLMEITLDFRHIKLAEVMTRTPRTLSADVLAAEAVSLMEKFHINQLIVTDERRHIIGALNMHDLFAAKVI